MIGIDKHSFGCWQGRVELLESVVSARHRDTISTLHTISPTSNIHTRRESVLENRDDAERNILHILAEY